MQILTVSGNIGKDGQIKQVRDQSVLSFTVAVKQGWGDKSSTNWYRVQVWGKRAETLAERAVKGTKVCVHGEFTIGTWEGKPQYDIRASEIEFMSGGQQQRTSAPQSSPAYEDDLDDSIPF